MSNRVPPTEAVLDLDEFEDACRDRGIRLFVLPPRSPKLNGSVERANRIHTEGLYELSHASPAVALPGAELRAWETVYNTIRPHQPLGYLTRAECLASVGVKSNEGTERVQRLDLARSTVGFRLGEARGALCCASGHSRGRASTRPAASPKRCTAVSSTGGLRG